MTKAEIIDKIASDADVSKSAAGNALESLTSSIVSSLKKGDKVTLVGFGTFSVSNRKARDGRNPRTGETIKIKASKAPKFSAGKSFKDALN